MRHEWEGIVIDEILERLVLDNQRHANDIARKVYNTATHALELDELRALAYLGLTQAADNWYSHCAKNGYDPENTKPFILYARPRIYGAIMDHLRAQDWAKRPLRAKSKLLRNAGQDQGATIKEMAERTGLTEKEVSNTLRAMGNKPTSIEGDQIDYMSPQSVESSTMTNYLLNSLVEAIKSLEPVARVVVVLHYVYGKKLKQVAKLVGITDSRASNIHTESVILLKQALLKAAEEQGIEFNLS